ncbi:transcription elongation factor spt5, partial [Coemansia sp. RSA 1933]
MSDGVEDMFDDRVRAKQRYSDDEDSESDSQNLGTRRRSQYSDDEDEDEIEEEDYSARKKKGARRKRPRTHNFLDIEASVDTDEEEEEDDEGALGDFIVDNEAELATAEKDALRHRSAVRPPVFQDDETLDADAIEAQLRERYSGYAASGARGRGAAPAADSEWVPQRLIIPDINAPHLWMARCLHGKERDASLAAARRVLERGAVDRFRNVFSVFCRDGLPGYLYVEAKSQADVQAVLDGIPGVFAHRLTLVPIGDMVDVVKVKAHVAKINPGAWVRVRRGNYAGDLAQVVSVIESSDAVEVRMLPRLDYGGETRAGGKGTRAPQRLFSVEDAQRADPRSLSSRQNEILWKGDRFINGYLHKDIRAASLQTENVGPTLEEIAKFAAGEAGEDGDEQAAIAALASQAAAASMGGGGGTADALEEANGLSAADLTPGELVEVVEGDLAGVSGVVRSIENNNVVRVTPEMGGLVRGARGGAMSFPARHLRKRFSVGDHVKVLNGRHRNETGMVLEVADSVVTVHTDIGRSQIRVLTKDLRVSSDVSTATTGATGHGAIVGLDIHDLVHLEGKQMGIVLKADRDSLTVLDDHNNMRTVALAAVRPTNSRFERSGVDSAGNAIRRGDSVREVSGARRQGAVLQVTRFVTYIQPRDQSSSAATGIFACRTRQVESLSARQNSLDPYATRTQRTTGQNGRGGSQNGRGRGGGHVGVLRGRRDPLLNKPVIACRGPYKGYMGIVKDVQGDAVRVELQTNSRVVTIDKDKLNVRQPSGETIPAAEYAAMGAGGASSGGANGGGAGHQAASWSTGSVAGGASAWGAPSPMPSRGYGDSRAAPSAASPAPYGSWDSAGPASVGPTGGWDSGSAAAAGGDASNGGWDSASSNIAGSGGWGSASNAGGGAAGSGWGASPGPTTPGAFPQTPGGPYPQTPGTSGGYRDAPTPGGSGYAPDPSVDGGFFAWAVVRAMVTMGGSGGQRGTIRELAPERHQAIIQLETGGTQVIDRSSVARHDLRPLRAEKRDRVVVIRGARKGALGTMVGRDGSEAFFQPDGDSSWHPEPLRNLA